MFDSAASSSLIAKIKPPSFRKCTKHMLPYSRLVSGTMKRAVEMTAEITARKSVIDRALQMGQPEQKRPTARNSWLVWYPKSEGSPAPGLMDERKMASLSCPH